MLVILYILTTMVLVILYILTTIFCLWYVMCPEQVVMRGVVFQVIIAAELLKNADDLVKCKIHPTSIISGYRLACKYVWLSTFLGHELS